MASRLNSNGMIQKAWMTSMETRLKRTLSCTGISSSGIWFSLSLAPRFPFQVEPSSHRSACPQSADELRTEYCGYWNDQLHCHPVTLTTRSGCLESLSIEFSSRAV